ncbi:homoserine dehydrogenase [Sulfolobus sp. A20]|uniref:homoserine dehydrogenase n=1 Tax=Saccharolobus sp. A20 TaxID=1891280 RepID=UPI0008461298|nr:homoserine dehydrogenase [Sulfolobus sp. A20]TRM75639.1 homoserine dehydrogenase [Sulfolobus sp. A20-N-F8]TRM79149.1 homoserine dehydrogenase [Sulfolobus sp. B5]TRM89256.1 homoserine dehydrogenase [Sulfolobus sp. C3]TRM94487.1 homoserine dehydrogenase [Sulfolobus sp. A20-N-G8]TRN02538.1 homoserine dehydrogenase [Sulfolobus sp. E1]
MKLLLVGYGNVGRAFRKLLYEKKDRYPILQDVEIAGIVTRRGFMMGDKDDFIPEKTINVIEALDFVNPEVVVDTSSPNYNDGEPSVSLYIKALSRGIHVITVNKAPLALEFQKLFEVAEKHGSKIGFQGTVMSGTPSINLYRVQPLVEVFKIRGILNGTTNYILSRIYDGLDFNSALKEAKEKGYAEEDPTLDLNGFDAAAKLTILVNLMMNRNLRLRDFKFRGIQNITNEEIRRSRAEGKKIKLLAYADNYVVEVSPKQLDPHDPLFNIDGVENALEIHNEIQRIVIRGPGAGPINAAYGALTDLVLLLKGCL